MFTDPEGPIEHFDWGRFKINGKIHSDAGEGVGKDIFLLGEEVFPWKARKGHKLSPKMVTCALNKDIAILVIGNGVNGALHVTKKTQNAIKEAGIKQLIIERTPKACGIYNRLARAGEQVALLVHGTC